ncbi:MAG TPA: hydrogenase expression/formation protein HypE [Candidatus Wallbacteria bacterium]|nr:hydrogenase expression/formation protein HypE [Candidatus Wallbacteria bacterium]
MNLNEREKYITEAHGNGGKLTHDLISSVFVKYFDNPTLSEGLDSGRLDILKFAAKISENTGFKFSGQKLGMTTDSYVVKPLFFNGGDIGKLAVTGTVNDLIVTGAIPVAITCGFIIEEGFKIETLETIVKSMARTASENGVFVATGDTKVVGRGLCDGVYINTSGVGLIPDGVDLAPSKISGGDAVIITGTPGNHGACILNERGGFIDRMSVSSDCAPLARQLSGLLDKKFGIKVMRDATRGGVATTLNEFVSQNNNFGIMLEEESISYETNAKSLADILGIDLLYSACEGRAIIVCPSGTANDVLAHLSRFDETSGAMEIGRVSEKNKGKVVIKTRIGGGRFLDMQVLEQFPRIC